MTKKKKRSTGWDDVPTQDTSVAFYQCYDSFNFTDEYEQVRLAGDVVTIEVGWVPALKKGGKGDTAYPVMSLTNNGNTNCPLVRAGITIQKLTLSNAIIRSIQENKPNKKIKIPKQKYRKKGDKFWSPIRVVKFPNGPANKIKNLKSLNKVRIQGKGFKTFPVNDIRHGIDLLVSFDKTQSGGSMYDIQKDERTPLIKEERNYLLYNLELVYDTVPSEEDIIEKLREAYEKGLFSKDNCNLKKLKQVISYSSDDEDEDDDFSMKNKKKKKKAAKKKSNKKKKKEVYEEEDYEDFDDEEDDIDGDDFDDEDDVEEEAEDEFDEDFEDDEEEDEDEFDDIDDEDEDFEEGGDFDDEDDYEEVKQKKKKKKKVVKKPNKKKKEKSRRRSSSRNRYED